MKLTVHRGEEVRPYLKDVARLRIEVFREWPYLYEGDLAYEMHYLESYWKAPDSLFVLAWDGDTAVGASTACGLKYQVEVKAPFDLIGPSTEEVYYAGESVLLKPYRGQGIGTRFFAEREAEARRLQFRYAAFAAVVREPDHPMRPVDHRPLDAFWGRLGYTKLPDHVGTLAWRDVGEEGETSKPMIFWIKPLDGPAY